MSDRLPIGLDSVILFATVLVGLSVIVLAPPSGPATAQVSIPHGGGSSMGAAGGGTPAHSNTGGASTPTTQAGTSTPSKTSSSNTGQQTTARSSSNQSKRLKLKDSKYAKYSYLISGQSLSSNAKRALDGFKRNRTRINDTAVRVTLIPYESQYNRYSVVVRNDQKLYFIETSFGDDARKRETQLNDDAPVKVDHNGYVIQ